MSGYCEDVTEEKSSIDATLSAQSEVLGTLGAATSHLAESLCPGQPTVPQVACANSLQTTPPQVQLDKLVPSAASLEVPNAQTAAEGVVGAIGAGSPAPSLSLPQEKPTLPAVSEECKVPSAESAVQAAFTGLLGVPPQLATGGLPEGEGVLGSVSSGLFGTSKVLPGAALSLVPEECKVPSKPECASDVPALTGVSQVLCPDKSAFATAPGNLSAEGLLPSGLQALQQPCKSPAGGVEDPSQYSDLDALLRGGTEGNDLMSSARNSLYRIASPNLPSSSLAQNPASSQAIAVCGRAASGNKWLFIVFQLFNVFLVLSSAGQVVASTFVMLSAGEVLWSNVSFIVTGAVSTAMGMLGPLTRSRDKVLLVYNTILTLESGVQTGMSIAGAVCESYKHQIDSNDLAELYKYGMLVISSLQFCTALFGWVYRCSLRASQLLSASIASLPYSPFK